MQFTSDGMRRKGRMAAAPRDEREALNGQLLAWSQLTHPDTTQKMQKM
jgi:hypothetical protein